MSCAGAGALGAVWGWLGASVHARGSGGKGVAAGAVAGAAVVIETALLAGGGAAVAAVGGLAVGAAACAVWLRALRARAEEGRA